MSDKDSNDGLGAFLAGILIGGLVGAATALLLAPKTGEETRELIKEKSIELKDRTSERAGEIAQKTKTRAVEMQQLGQSVLDEQREKLTKKGVSETPVEEVKSEPEANVSA